MILFSILPYTVFDDMVRVAFGADHKTLLIVIFVFLGQHIKNPSSSQCRTTQISNNAQKKLAELQLDDIETLVSLRLTGRQRIWGIKIQNIFKILW